MRDYETVPGAVPPGAVVCSIVLCCMKAMAAAGAFSGALGGPLAPLLYLSYLIGF